MILKALVELAEREGLVQSPDFEIKRVNYVLTIGEGGRFLKLRSLGNSDRPGGGIPQQIPRPLPGARRSGTTIDPGFLVDNASFVLGMNSPGDADKKSYPTESLRDRQMRFRGLISEAARETNDESLLAVDQFLADLVSGSQKVILPAEAKSNALFAFQYYRDEDCFVHAQYRIVEYWGTRRARSAPQAGTGGTFPCLVLGQRCEPVDKHPLVLRVPGGTPSGIAFVTFNQDVFESHGLHRNENAPISRRAAEAYTEALKRLLAEEYPDPHNTGSSLPRRNFRLSANTVVLFWSTGDPNAVDLFADAVGTGDPEAVRSLYSATWKGQAVALQDTSRFYALTLRGAQGRGTVRGWHETTLQAVLANVRQYFYDLCIHRPRADAARPLPLRNLLRQLAVQNEYDNIPSGLAAETFAAIVAGQPLPREVLAAAVRRNRAERTPHYADRAALIKATLNRLGRAGLLAPHIPKVDIMLDENCPSPAYRLGRLFAVLEKIQEDATNANVTIRDRYYGAASATPVVVFPQLLRKVPHHLAKLNSSVRYDKLIQAICAGLQPPRPFPATLSLEEQGLFAVGYYHQRQALYTPRDTEPTE